MTNIFSGTHYYDEVKNAKRSFPWYVTLIIFLLVFWVSQSILSFVVMIFITPMFMEYIGTIGTEPDFAAIIMQLNEFLQAPPAEYAERMILVQLFGTIILAAIAFIAVRFIEGRSLRSMGFTKNKAPLYYLAGLGIGLAAFSASLLMAVVTGNAEFAGTGRIASPVMYAAICIGWILQGAEEEIVCRGWLMSSLSAKMPMWAAVVINSAFFSVMHLFNSGFSVLASINILLIGIVLSLIAVRFNNIWISCAFHSVWNWVQGNFYGLPVSGMSTGSSVLRFELSGSDLWTGGRFGIESGLGATIVSVVLIALLLLIPQKKKPVPAQPADNSAGA